MPEALQTIVTEHSESSAHRRLASACTIPTLAAWAGVLTVVFAGWGWASKPGGGEGSAVLCPRPQPFRVTVEVTCVAAGCRASVDHPRVAAQGNDVVWIIDNKPGQAYTFRGDAGVAFKTEAGRNVFRCHVEANGNRYACMNRRTPGTYEYGIQLGGSPAVPPLDPWIVNH